MNRHKLRIPEIFELPGANQHGLSSFEADQKLLETGPNDLQEAKRKA